MGCAGCAMHKDPQPSEGPINPRGPQQFEGPQQSDEPSAIWRTPDNLRAPINLRSPINLRGPSNLRSSQQSEWPSAIWMDPTIEGPYQSERPTAIWRAPAIRGVASNLRGSQQSDEPPLIWGALPTWEVPSNLRGPSNMGSQQSEVPSAIWRAPAIWGALNNWGSDPWELLSFRQAFFQCCNEVNHLQNCSTSRWLLCSVIYIQWGLYCPNVAADVASDCCEIEDHQKLYKLPCIKTAEWPGNVVNRKIFQIAWHLKSSRHFCAWESSQTNILTFRNW